MGMLTMIKSAPRAVVKAAGKTMFALKKAKPQILVVGGVVIATGAFVLAVMNARKMDAVMAESEDKVTEAEMARAEAEENKAGLSEKEQKTALAACDKDIRKAKAEGAWKMFCLIGVPSLAFIGGISMTVGGHIVLLKRFGQLSTAFAGLQETFQRYREANIREHGEECDRRYIYGIVDETETTAKVTDENGKEKTVKCKIPVVDGEGGHGLYTFEFSEAFSRKCPKDPVNTISFLRSQEKYWNIWMKSTGKPVTLSMVLEELGIEMDPDDPMNDYILIAGWRPNGDGDNEIDFGIMRAVNKRAISMEENVVMLNFNCDGNIYHSTRYTKDGRKVG